MASFRMVNLLQSWNKQSYQNIRSREGRENCLRRNVDGAAPRNVDVAGETSSSGEKGPATGGGTVGRGKKGDER